MNVSMTVNNTSYEREVEPRTLLVDFLRDDLGLTGTNIGCDTSQCGACTVHIDPSPTTACFIVMDASNPVNFNQGLEAPAPLDDPRVSPSRAPV